MAIGRLAPGVRPDELEPRAADAAALLTTLEASSVNLVGGQARITVRFSADEDDLARQIGEHVAASTAASAEVTEWWITKGPGSRWKRLPS
ncbi:hypothetical protein [Naasia lichenicola]|nr:hypothetical protein [Naasia lichenicola]